MLTLPRTLKVFVSLYLSWLLLTLFTNSFRFEDILVNMSDEDWDRFRLLAVLPPIFVIITYGLFRWCSSPETERLSQRLISIFKARPQGERITAEQRMILDYIKFEEKARREGRTLTEADKHAFILEGAKRDIQQAMRKNENITVDTGKNGMLVTFGEKSPASQTKLAAKMDELKKDLKAIGMTITERQSQDNDFLTATFVSGRSPKKDVEE